LKAVILAGGLGTRLKPFTEVIPKPLLPIGEKAILEIQIEHLKKYGFDEIFLATNYKSEYIKNFFGDGSRYGVDLVISQEKEALGTVGPLSLLKNELNEPFLLMNGDILTSMDFSEFYNNSVRKNNLLSVSVKKYVLPYAFGNIFFEKDYVTGIEEKPNIITYALAGVYVMNPKVLDLVPDNTYYGMDKLIKEMLSQNLKISVYEITEYWLDIGNAGDYEKAQKNLDNIYKNK